MSLSNLLHAFRTSPPEFILSINFCLNLFVINFSKSFVPKPILSFFLNSSKVSCLVLFLSNLSKVCMPFFNPSLFFNLSKNCFMLFNFAKFFNISEALLISLFNFNLFMNFFLYLSSNNLSRSSKAFLESTFLINLSKASFFILFLINLSNLSNPCGISGCFFSFSWESISFSFIF